MMRLSVKFCLLLLISLAVAAPAPDSSSSESKESNESGDKLTITKEFFPNSLAVYSGDHEIVNILVPLNSMNFDEDSEDDDTKEDDEPIIFFVEADKNESGGRVDKGLYMLRGGKSRKLLENGRDAAASSDDSKDVYFAASDGVYVYKFNDSEPTKYGKFDQGIISIAKENATDVIYVLTDSRDLYKITDEGKEWTKVDGVDRAKEIVLDYSNNLYFYGDDLQPYVVANGVKKIQGLPLNPKSVRLLKPPILLEDGVPFLSDDVAYIIYANGTSETSGFDFKSNAKPSAFGMEATLIQYYAYDKKIYEYNILLILMSELIDELKNFLQSNSDTIRTISTRSRSTLRSK